MGHADRSRPGPGVVQRLLQRLGDDDPRHLVVEAKREAVAREGEDAGQHRHRPASEHLGETVEHVEVEDDLGHREPCAGLDLRAEPLGLLLEVVGGRVDRHAGKERGRRVDRPAVEVLATVQARDQRGQPDRIDLVDPLRAGIVADLGRVAGDREHVAHGLRVRAEQQRLEPEHGRVARRQVRDRLEARRSLDRARDHQRADPGACSRVVVHVDEPHEPRLLERRRDLEQAAARAAERRVELHRDDELARAERLARAPSRAAPHRARSRPRVRSRRAATAPGGRRRSPRGSRRSRSGSCRSSRRSRARRGRAPVRRTRRSTRASRAGRSPCRRAGSRDRCSAARPAGGRRPASARAR